MRFLALSSFAMVTFFATLAFAETGSGSSTSTSTSTGTQTHTHHHHTVGQGLYHMLERQTKHLEKKHAEGKVSDDEYAKLKQELDGIKTALDAAVADGNISHDERKAIEKMFKTYHMDLAEAEHGPHSGHHEGATDDDHGDHHGGGSTSTSTSTNTSTSHHHHHEGTAL